MELLAGQILTAVIALVVLFTGLVALIVFGWLVFRTAEKIIDWIEYHNPF